MEGDSSSLRGYGTTGTRLDRGLNPMPMPSPAQSRTELAARFDRGATLLAVSMLALAGLSAAARAAEPAMQSFDNLFRELQAIEGQAAGQGQPVDGEALAREVNRIVDARNEVFRRDGGLFDTVRETARVEGDYMRALNETRLAAAKLAEANARLAREQGESLRQQRETPGLGQARADASEADADLRHEQEALAAVTSRLRDLYARLRRNLSEFFQHYIAMRQLLPHERGPRNATLVKLLRDREGNCPDWVEGQVLMAVAEAYDGDVRQAEACLEHAGAIMRSCPQLITTMIAEDCCSTWLLLGKADKVKPYTDVIRRTPARLRTAVHEWLLGADARVRGRHDEAAKSLLVAVSKAKKKAPPALVAETALAVLLADTKGRRTAKAADLLADVKSDETWPVLQSRAALAAAEGRWGDAMRLIESCQEKAPPCLDVQLASQRASYADEAVWRP